MQLTPQQTKILEEAQSGRNLIIEARAGCGKSTTLVEIAKVLYPKKVICLAFNKLSQEDLSAKIERANSESPINAIARTFNSIGHGSFTRRIKIDKRKPWYVLEDFCQEKNVSFSRSEKADLVALLSAARNFGLVPPSAGGSPLLDWSDDSWERVFKFCEVEFKKETLNFAQSLLSASINRTMRGLADYTDQLYHPAIWGGNFPYADAFLIDEAQDLSPIQHRIMSLLPTRQLMAVGDPRQAIYAFRGALSDSMEKLWFSMNKPEILPLSKTWRCAKSIVYRQTHLVPDFTAREDAEDGLILDWRDGPWPISDIKDGFAVLCRNNAPLIKLACEFLKVGRKAQILGKDFAERLQRDIDKAVGEKAPSSTPCETLFVKLEEYYKKTNSKADLTPSQEDRIEALRACSKHGCASNIGELRALLNQIFSDEKAPITLATAHKAKGLEWDTVVHLNPSLIPSKYAKTEEELTQEENIRYVLETRPRQTLILAELSTME